MAARKAKKSRTALRPAAKATKKLGGKPMPIKAAAKAAAKAPAKPATKATAPKGKAKRASWLDDARQTPMIDKYARQLTSFIKAMADGRIDESELKDQESRLVALMKEVEPLLDDDVHARVTQLLCELTAYDLMQVLHSLHAGRPKSVFRG